MFDFKEEREYSKKFFKKMLSVKTNNFIVEGLSKIFIDLIDNFDKQLSIMFKNETIKNIDERQKLVNEFKVKLETIDDWFNSIKDKLLTDTEIIEYEKLGKTLCEVFIEDIEEIFDNLEFDDTLNKIH